MTPQNTARTKGRGPGARPSSSTTTRTPEPSPRSTGTVEAQEPRTAYSYIRFSHIDQEKGDSLTRQTRAAEQYCLVNNLLLDTSVTYLDRGVSAFKSKNSTTGRLAEFLRLAETGQLKKNSVLLVENLDRLSRDEVLIALDLLRRIVTAGVDVHTLMDNRVYNRTTINDFATLVVALSIMARASEDVKTRSVRIKSAWQQVLVDTAEQGMPPQNMIPPWVNAFFDSGEPYHKDKKHPRTPHYKLDPDRAATVRLIYKYARQGKGLNTIRRLLNSGHVPTFASHKTYRSERTTQWHNHSIFALLRNRATYGVLTLPDGKMVPNYFPAVISEETFKAVQQTRNRTPRPRGPATATNLFTGLIHCGYCGAAMEYIDKGTYGRDKKSQTRLVCKAFRYKGGDSCVRETISYQDVEHVIFERGLYDVHSILSTTTEKDTRVQEARDRLAELTAQQEHKKKQLARLTDALADAESPAITASVRSKMVTVDREMSRLATEIESLSRKIQGADSGRAGQATETIRTAVQEGLTDEATRQKVKSALRDVIESIQVYSIGEGGRPTKEFVRRSSANDPRARAALRINYKHTRETVFVRLRDPIVDIGFTS